MQQLKNLLDKNPTRQFSLLSLFSDILPALDRDDYWACIILLIESGYPVLIIDAPGGVLIQKARCLEDLRYTEHYLKAFNHHLSGAVLAVDRAKKRYELEILRRRQIGMFDGKEQRESSAAN